MPSLKFNKPFRVSRSAAPFLAVHPEKPYILFEGKHSFHDLALLKKRARIWKIQDKYELQLRELFEITHPHQKANSRLETRREKFIKDERQKKTGSLIGDWIYYPWSGILVHSLRKEDSSRLRTNRNRNLITETEQKILLKAPVGIAGLSVGSHVALALTYGGIGETMKLAEYDTLNTTNLNRLQGRIDQIGEPKISITAQKIYEVNPYADLILFEDGLTESRLDEFVFRKPSPRVIVEVIDNFEMKIHLRQRARQAGIPVISCANLGDRVLMDIDRYDTDRNLPFFSGMAGDISEQILKQPDITDADKHRYAVELVGRDNIPKEALESVKEIGKTLVGRPQLMSTVTISGGIAAYLVRQIILGKTNISGRKLFKLNTLLL